MPFEDSSRPKSNPVRIGNEIYLGTSVGIWSFDVIARSWKHLPGMPTTSFGFEVGAMDEHAVWLKPPSSTNAWSFLVRFDKKTHEWKLWTEDDGIPAGSKISTIIPDGVSCWVISNNGLLHLSPKTDRWENVPRMLGGAADIISFRQVVPDGKQVWLELSEQTYGAGDNPFFRAVIVRYDIETGKFTPLESNIFNRSSIHCTQFEKDFIWYSFEDALTENGVVYRLDKKTLEWKEIPIPKALLHLGEYNIRHIEQRGDQLWLVGSHYSIQMEAPK